MKAMSAACTSGAELSRPHAAMTGSGGAAVSMTRCVQPSGGVDYSFRQGSQQIVRKRFGKKFPVVDAVFFFAGQPVDLGCVAGDHRAAQPHLAAEPVGPMARTGRSKRRQYRLDPAFRMSLARQRQRPGGRCMDVADARTQTDSGIDDLAVASLDARVGQLLLRQLGAGPEQI